MIGAIDSFTEITGFDLSNYLGRYSFFVRTHKPKLELFFRGVVKIVPESSFSELNILLIDSVEINNLFEMWKNRLNNLKFWELIEFVEDVKISLATMDNMSKWLRSSIVKGVYSNEKVPATLNQNQTLEQLAASIGSTNPDQDWIDLAIENDIEEEDYTTDGGNILYINGFNRKAINLQAVVDNIVGDKAYGIDINQRLTFTDDDLEVLDYKSTVKQAVGIMSYFIKGDAPEYPNLGLQKSLVVGTNRNSISFPIVLRQYFEVFRTDDTLRSLSITKFGIKSDYLEIEFSVKTVLSDTIKKTTNV